MLKWFKKHWILSIFLFVGGVPTGLNYSGFCWAEKRWLSDDEIIYKAISHIITNVNGAVYSPAMGGISVKLVNEDSVEKFLLENPNCCGVGYNGLKILEQSNAHLSDGIWYPEWYEKFVGAYSDVVILHYKENYINRNNQQETRLVTTDLAVNGCGNPYHWPR